MCRAAVHGRVHQAGGVGPEGTGIQRQHNDVAQREGGLNLVGGRVLGRAESLLVYAKVAVLAAFTLLKVWSVRVDRVSLPAFDVGGTVLAAVLFLAYEGFGLMASTAEEIRDPGRNLPRAFMVAVTAVVVVYVAVSFVTVGVADQASLVGAKDYALAVAAEAVGGSWAFTVIAVTALVSTAGSLNATLYGAAKVSYVLGVHAELPQQLGRHLWNKPVAGLLVTAALVTVVTNAVDLSGISLMGSASFLTIYAAVNVAAVRLPRDTSPSMPRPRTLEAVVPFRHGLRWRWAPRSSCTGLDGVSPVQLRARTGRPGPRPKEPTKGDRASHPCAPRTARWMSGARRHLGRCMRVMRPDG